MMFKQPNKATAQHPVFSEFLLLVLGCAFLFFTSYHLLTPVVPLYLEQLKFDGQSIGFVVAAFMVGSIIMRPLAGKLADESNKIKLLLISTIIFSIAPIGFPVFKHPLPLMLIRLVQGGCYALFYTTALSMVLQHVPQARRTEGISHFSNSMKLAVALSPLCAGWLSHLFGLEINFIGAALLGLVCTAAIIYTARVGEKVSKKQHAQRSALHQEKTTIKKPKGRLLNAHGFTPGIVMASNSAVFGAIVPFAALISSAKGFPEAGGLFYTMYGVSLIFSRTLTGKWSDQLGRHAVLLPGMSTVILAVIGVILANSPLTFWGAAALYGFAAGTVQPSLMAVAADEAPASEHGSTMATFSLINDIGVAIGSFLMGVIGHEFGYTWALVVVTLLMFLGITYYGVSYKKSLPLANWARR